MVEENNKSIYIILTQFMICNKEPIEGSNNIMSYNIKSHVATSDGLPKSYNHVDTL